jgi:hypothetical protein
MKTIKTVEEFQLCIDEVNKTKKEMNVKIEMTDFETEKVRKKLKMDGVDVVVKSEYDVIKPLE